MIGALATAATALGCGANFALERGTGFVGNANFTANWATNLADMDIGSGGKFGLRGNNITIDALTDAGDLYHGFNSGAGAGTKTVTVGVDGGSGVISGIIHGNGTSGTLENLENGVLAIVKTGSGTQTLSGANTYSGGTTVSQGTLRTTNTTGLGTGAATMGDSNTGSNNVQLTLAANNIANNITVTSNGSGTATIFGETQFQGHTGTIAVNRSTIFQTPTRNAHFDSRRRGRRRRTGAWPGR
jgi:autotransporter-associated beta strand protein